MNRYLGRNAILREHSLWWVAVGLSAVLGASGCGGSQETGMSADRGFDGGMPIGDGGAAEDPSAATSSEEEGQGGQGQSQQAGQLTAGDWDDNQNYELFKRYTEGFTQSQAGLHPWNAKDRILIQATNENGEAISNAVVEIREGDTLLWSAPTGSNGQLVFLPRQDAPEPLESYAVMVQGGAAQPGVASVTSTQAGGAAQWHLTLAGARAEPPTALDLVFVVDTTGSMGDELSYIQGEIASIVEAIREQSGNVEMRFAMILYRDEGDDYVTRVLGFTSSQSDFREKLDNQRAAGGGDYEEAVHKAMAAANQLSFRKDNAARVLFWIADAPPHREQIEDFLGEVQGLRQKGVKIYPVAASGVADVAEYLMRLAAQASMARYTFLTDDSGIGNPHAEPHLPCFQVQYLKNILEQAILTELTGKRVLPDPQSVLKRVGSPEDGICTLKDGTKAYL